MQKVFKMSELPAGSRMLPRTARPLNGHEVVEVVGRLLEQRGAAAELLGEFEGWAQRQGWYRVHLTYPTLRVAVRVQPAGLQVEIGGLAGKVAEWHSAGYASSEPGQQAAWGPFAAPDQWRQECGLGRTAQFQTPRGDVITVELDDSGRAERPDASKVEAIRLQMEERDREMKAAEQRMAEQARQVEAAAQAVGEPEGGVVAEPPALPAASGKAATAQPLAPKKPVGAKFKEAKQ